MALSELLRTLEEEAGHRVEEILARARAEAARIREDSEAVLARRRAAALGAHDAELRKAAARALEAARRAATRRVLEARAEALARVRDRAAERLAARAGDAALLPILRRDVGEGLRYLGEGPVVVEADAVMLDRLRGAVNGRPEVTFAPAPGRSGIVIRSADGRITVDASLESRLEHAWPGLAIELARRLES